MVGIDYASASWLFWCGVASLVIGLSGTGRCSGAWASYTGGIEEKVKSIPSSRMARLISWPSGRA
jgi:hypothetical protein